MNHDSLQGELTMCDSDFFLITYDGLK